MWRFKLAVLCLVCLFVMPNQAQIQDLLTITVDGGYGGFYRPDHWTPLHVTIQNRGAGIQGRVIVRPETSAGGLSNAYSLPVDLPPQTGDDPAVFSDFLYVILDGGDATLRVEFLNEDDGVLISRDVTLRALAPRDALHVVLSESTNLSNPITLDNVHPAGYRGYTIYWQLNNLPDRAGGLDAVNTILFNDINTSDLDDADATFGAVGIQQIEQKAALRAWVLNGGHLIVTGGAAWELTANGLQDMLPFVPQSFQTAQDLTPMAHFAADYETELSGDYFLTVGEIIGDVLLTNAAGDPLIIRRGYGNGTVDYLTVDPNAAPLVNWRNRDKLWFTLATSTQARPNWSYGFSQWDQGTTAMEILPGVTLLPAVMTLIGFLAAYVLLIGPINYFILSRINRQGYAWVTIPFFIGIFSVLAFQLGFQIRGDRVILSRLSVIQTWQDSQQAHVHQLIGLLAPRRNNYTLSMDDGRTRDDEQNDPLGDTRMLRPVGQEVAVGSFVAARTPIEIQQGVSFTAVDFPVDASFIAGFSTNGALARPAIDGLVTVDLSQQETDAMLRLRGSVRNNTEFTLHDPVILARGVVLPLDTSLQPGEQIVFDTNNETSLISEPAVPVSMEYARDTDDVIMILSNMVPYSSRPTVFSYDNVLSILGSNPDNPASFTAKAQNASDEFRRRQAFLQSFIRDQYGSTARGNSVYLIGWTDQAPYTETVPNELTRTVDTTLYIVELAVQYDTPQRSEIVITEDQFTWVSIDRTNAPNAGVIRVDVPASAEIVFRFTPLPGSVLDEVNALDIIYNRRDSRVASTFEIWNWEAAEWEVFTIMDADRMTFDDPARFLGPLNAVQIRATPRGDGGNLTIDRIGIEQRGNFTG